jgi:hypothetical protein
MTAQVWSHRFALEQAEHALQYGLYAHRIGLTYAIRAIKTMLRAIQESWNLRVIFQKLSNP